MSTHFGRPIEYGVPDWIKELVGDDWSELTQKVVVTFTNKAPAHVRIECYCEGGKKPDVRADYLRVLPDAN